MRKLGISFGSFGYDVDLRGQAQAIKNAGFDTVFVSARRKDLSDVCREIAAAGLELESMHATFQGVSSVWGDGGDVWIGRLCRELDLCREYGASYLTAHCMNVPQFNPVSEVKNAFTEAGAARFAEVAAYAEKIGVKIAFENVEFPGNELYSLIRWLRERDLLSAVGVTWDVGHWHCYPDGTDFLPAFGDLLIGTHVHDNFGCTDRGLITWNDDCHVLPFDGTVDFRAVGQTLDACGYTGSITLELGRSRVIPWYAASPDIDAYLAEAYIRARHAAAFCADV